VKANGSDAVNDLSYLILDVIEEMRLLQPSSMVQMSKKNPDRFLKRALNIVKTGFGQPSIFNTEAIVQELVRQGKTLEDARCGGASGCVESRRLRPGGLFPDRLLQPAQNAGTHPEQRGRPADRQTASAPPVTRARISGF
jgi:hypothetical protein